MNNPQPTQRPPSQPPSGLRFILGRTARGILQSGLLTLILGILGIVWPVMDSRVLNQLSEEEIESRELIYNLSINAGVAFFASSLIILLIEPSNRRQSEEVFNAVLRRTEENYNAVLQRIEEKFNEKVKDLEEAEQDSIIYSLIQKGLKSPSA